MSDDLKSKVQDLIDTMINPAVAGHGGFVELIDVQDNRVYLQMGGGSQGCGAADITLKSGIQRLIKEEIPEVAEVLDTTAHGAAWGGAASADCDESVAAVPAHHDVPHRGVHRGRDQARRRARVRVRATQYLPGADARLSGHARFR